MVISNAFVERLDFKSRLVGEAKETLFIDENMEGVKGVLASERARAREGVLGRLYIGSKRQRKDKQGITTRFQHRSCDRFVVRERHFQGPRRRWVFRSWKWVSEQEK